MRYTQAVISSILLLTVPSTILHSNPLKIRPTIQHEQAPSLHPSIDAIPSYDDIIQLLHDLESGELEKRCQSYEDVQKLARFLIDLARKGMLSNETEAAMQLEEEIAALEAVLRGEFDEFVYGFTDESWDQLVIPAIFYGDAEFIQCRNWFKKQFHHLKDFAKRHKKALIIAAAVVVATAVAVGLVAAASAAGAAGAAAAGSGDGDSHSSRGGGADPASLLEGSPELRTALDEHIASLKNDLVSNRLLELQPGDAFSLEENGRVIGSLIAHDSFRNLNEQLFYNTSYDRDLERAQNPFSTTNFVSGQEVIDQKFHTDYAPLYATHNTDFRTLSLQAHGETALAQGSYQQAILDFERVVERTPTNPFPYLDRGVAHFGAGEYDRALEDY